MAWGPRAAALPHHDTPGLCAPPGCRTEEAGRGRKRTAVGKGRPAQPPGPGSCFRDKPFPRGSPCPGPSVFLRAAETRAWWRSRAWGCGSLRWPGGGAGTECELVLVQWSLKKRGMNERTRGSLGTQARCLEMGQGAPHWAREKEASTNWVGAGTGSLGCMGPDKELGRGSHKQFDPSQASLGIGNSFRPFRLTMKPRASKHLPRIAPPCLGRGKQSSALQSWFM